MLKINLKKKVKKKEKPKKFVGKGLKIVDEDSFGSGYKPPSEESEEEAEDLPAIAAVVDERPVEVQVLESFNKGKWKRMEDDLEQKSVTPSGNGPRDVDNDDDLSPPRIAKDRDSSPPRRSRLRSSSRDASPPRRNRPRSSSRDASPPRRRRRSSSRDASPPRRNRPGSSNRDRSPPRRNRRSSRDTSPPRRNRNRSTSKDVSPPRRQKRRDSRSPSPSRRNQRRESGHTSPSRRRDARRNSPDRSRARREPVESPPRRTGNKRNSPDLSPPRQGKRKGSEDVSPPRQRKRRDSDDASPPRRRDMASSGRNPNNWRRDRDRNVARPEVLDTTDEEKSKTTLDGKRAGLQKATALRDEMLEFRKRENEMFEQLPDDVSGRNAKAVKRDRRTEEDFAKEREKEKKEAERKSQYNKWSKGLKQVEEQEERVRSALHEMAKPLARHKDDDDLEDHLKNINREGDPMLEYLTAKRRKATGMQEKPKYSGPPPPPNRFKIPPGYRWDGVDRSNGYEKDWFGRINARKALDEEAYKWSVEDL